MLERSSRIDVDIPPEGALVRYLEDSVEHWGVVEGETVRRLDATLSDLLELPAAQAQRRLEAPRPAIGLDEIVLQAPIDGQDVWAAGVTYERSRGARIEESGAKDLYQQVYEGERPELFFKARADRVVGPGAAVGFRADSDWNVPEPELVLVLNERLEIFGLTIGNDMSSRSIEGANALHLPQAKVYDRSCAIGPGIVPTHRLDSRDLEIRLRVIRADDVVFEGATSTARMRRSWEDLAEWLGRATSFPGGVLLMTGTGIVPEPDFTLARGDSIEIAIDRLGVLTNPVVEVGRVVAGQAR